MDKTAAAGRDAGIRTALGRIDRVRCLLALLDDATDSAEEIRLSGEAVIGLKQALRDARASLQDAREALEGVAYAPLVLDRARTGTASASGAC